MSKIICGFPGVGKSYIFEHNFDLNIVDSDSTRFSHKTIRASDGYRRVPNEEFPKNYIEHIKHFIDIGTDIILVSTHEEVRNALIEEGIEFTMVYPDIKFKNEYLGRYINRGSGYPFINKMKDNFDKWILDIENINNDKIHKVRLDKYGMYLSDVFSEIIK